MDSAVVGLGKLGAPMAALLAAVGNHVWGVDLSDAFVTAVGKGVAPVQEPGLQDLMDASEGRLTATTDFGAAIPASELVFLVVPTPSGPDGLFSLDFVLDACRRIAPHLGAGGAHRVVVVTSTVNPGDTERVITPFLETASGLVAGRDFSIAYNPEFIALGSVVHDMRHPDFILVGSNHDRALAALREVYGTIHRAGMPPLAELTPSNAEIAKLAVNTFVTTRISYANMLTRICERTPGGDVDAVTHALGLDSRIGPKYLRGGMPFGGPCFPRDNTALEAFATSVGVDAPLATETNRMNIIALDHLVQLVLEAAPRGDSVAVLGLAYKPGTPVVEAAPGIAIANRLADEGYSVVAHDPEGLANAAPQLDERIRTSADVDDAIDEATVLVIVTPWDSIVDAVTRHLARPEQAPRVVVDGWRVLHRAIPGVSEPHRYVAPGIAAPRATEMEGFS